MKTLRITVDQAREVARAALLRSGLSPDDAQTVLEALIDADLTGRTGHGLIRIPQIVRQAPGHGSDHIRVLRDTGTAIAIDGGGALGYLVAHRAACLARARLADEALVAVGCRGTSHTGAIGYYARLVAEAGHVALAMADCCPMIAPYGARRAVFGTNPLALACPGLAHPVVVDFSPGKTTYGAIQNARERQQPLPEGVAIDAQGNPTTEPQAALGGAILPIGGARGSALALLIQIMAGALCGAAATPEPGTDYGFFLLGMRLDVFAGRDDVYRGIAELVEAVRQAGAHCPGDRSAAHRAACLERGIEVGESLWGKVGALARVALP